MKKQLRIVKKGEDDGNVKYWRSLTPEKRLKNLEELRKDINNRKYDTQQGFQRVYSIIKRK